MPKASDITALYEKHNAELLAYLGRRCPADVAHDLLQETFLQVIRHVHLDAVTMPRAWLFGIARNVLARHYRQEAGSIRAIDDREEPSNREAADPRMELVRQAIARLAPDLRETLELRFEQELSYDEIAAVLDVPVGTVRSRLHNSVKRLREALSPEGINP